MKPYLFRLLILVMTGISAFNGAYAQGCQSGDCNNGFGTYKYSTGDTYAGEHVNSLRNGFGVYTWSTGAKHIGENRNDKLNGYGVYYHANGDVYLGEFKDGQYEGEGTYKFRDGRVQAGLWTKGEYKGKISYYGKGADAKGCLNGDCANGYGMFAFNNGDRYFGYFKNNKLDGYGSYYYSSGAKFIGEFTEGKLNGFGVYYWSNGEKYAGFWKDGRRNQWGMNYYPDGRKSIGLWEMDRLTKTKDQYVTTAGAKTGCISGDCNNGNGVFIYNNGFYNGNFKNGYRNGKGTYFFDSGDYYYGDWVDNKRTGSGYFYFTEGGKYVGNFRNQFFDGKGFYFYHDGIIDDGYFTEGKYVGKTMSANNNAGYANNNTTGNNTYSNTNNNSGYNNNTTTNTTNSNNTTYNNTTTTKNNGGFTAGNTTGVKEKRLALVMGVSNYTNGVSKLKNPVNDSRSMANALRTIGFDVIELNDGSRDQMFRSIQEFGERLKNYTVGMLFYAGHGMQVDGVNYLIPADARITSKDDIRFICINADFILSKMELAGTKANIIILDACRNNPFERSFSRDDSNPGLATMNAPVGSIIAYSCAPNKTASDGSGSNGLYTGELLRYIQQPGAKIEDVFKQVRKSVLTKSNTSQVPWETSSLIGDFFFSAKVQ